MCDVHGFACFIIYILYVCDVYGVCDTYVYDINVYICVW